MTMNRREALATGAAFVASPLAFASDDATQLEVPKLKTPKLEVPTLEFQECWKEKEKRYEAYGLHWFDEKSANVYSFLPDLEHLTTIIAFDDSPQPLPAGFRGHLIVDDSSLLKMQSGGEDSAIIVFGYRNFDRDITVYPERHTERQESVNMGQALAIENNNCYSFTKQLFRSSLPKKDEECMLIIKDDSASSASSCIKQLTFCPSGMLNYMVLSVTSFKAREYWYNMPLGIEGMFFHNDSVTYAKGIGKNREEDQTKTFSMWGGCNNLRHG